MALVPTAILVLAGWSRRWVSDDGFINLRVVQNIVEGNGPVYNAGERVEAHTSTLWVYLLAVVNWVTGIRLEWLAVVFGIALSAAGVFFAARAAQQLARRDSGAGMVVPLGALVFVAVSPVWDFASSGLENGMAFAWMGSTFYAVVRAYRRGIDRWTPVAAVLTGLGPLIRPDLALFSAGFIVALLIALWPLRRTDALRWVALGLAAPVAYQAFRMGYYAAVVPNTAFAKEAGRSYWDAGWTYFTDFVTPYLLWVPALLLLGWWGSEARTRWRGSERRGVAIGAIPVGVALLHALFVIKVGGDFMHARLLLPTLFGLVLPLAFVLPEWRSLPMLGAGVVLAWALVCGIVLRSDFELGEIRGNIADEREFYSALAGVENPVRIDDYSKTSLHRNGRDLEQRDDRNRTLTLNAVRSPRDPLPELPLLSGIQQNTAAYAYSIGIIGYRAGLDVRMIDALGLADPIASRVELRERGRPGHEKVLFREWPLARYAEGDSWQNEPVYAVNPQLPPAERALGCGELREVILATASNLTPRRFIDNIGTAITTYGFRFPNMPVDAERALCR